MHDADPPGSREVHGHSHAHTLPRISRRDEKRRLGWAIVFTSAILFVEFVGGLLSGSLALISDAGHMLVDSLSLVMSYIALNLATRPVRGRFTYGLRRVEILAALVNGVTLLLVCAFIGYEAVQRLMHPAAVDAPMMLGIALVGITANIASALLLKHAHTLNARSAFLHVLGDLFSSAGIVVGGVVMLLWDVPWLDPALSLAIAVVVVVSAYRLTREAVAILLEAAPDGVDITRIHDAILDLPYVTGVHDFHVWTITSDLHAVSCHIVLHPDNTSAHDHVLAEISQLLREQYHIEHTTLQLESRAYNDGETACLSC
ncbi:MAG: cation transporter [Ignavibacteriae bacterium]|nr:cation transporter [Ignavibacteriota bacterium]